MSSDSSRVRCNNLNRVIAYLMERKGRPNFQVSELRLREALCLTLPQ